MPYDSCAGMPTVRTGSAGAWVSGPAASRVHAVEMEQHLRLLTDAGFTLAQTVRAATEMFEDYDQHFEEGLALVIAGIGTRYGIG